MFSLLPYNLMKVLTVIRNLLANLFIGGDEYLINVSVLTKKDYISNQF